MSQDKEREAFEAWVNEQPEAQGMWKKWWCRQIDDGGYSCHEPDVMWRAWQARAALASQQAVKGEPVHPNHRPDLRYILTTLERVTPVVKHQKELREQVQASITGMRYVIERTEAASPPSREPLTDDAILDAFCHTPGIHQFVQAFKAGARFAERAHGIHSRGEGEKA